MKNIRSLFVASILCLNVSLYAFIEADWEIMTPVAGVKMLIKSNDFGLKYEFPVVVGAIKGKITAKTVAKGLKSFADNESEFIITQCMGNKLPTAYSWADTFGSRIAGILAVFSRDASVKKDLLQFYELKRQLLKVKNLEKKKELLRKCVLLKYSIKEKIKNKKEESKSK